MIKGELDVAWLVVYTAQGELNEQGYESAYKNAISKFDAIDRLVNVYAPDQVELALTSEDVKRILAKGKKVIMIGVENAYSMGLDTSNVEKFWQRGADMYRLHTMVIVSSLIQILGSLTEPPFTTV